MMRSADPDCELCHGSGVHPDSFPGSTGGWNGPQPPEPEPGDIVVMSYYVGELREE